VVDNICEPLLTGLRFTMFAAEVVCGTVAIAYFMSQAGWLRAFRTSTRHTLESTNPVHTSRSIRPGGKTSSDLGSSACSQCPSCQGMALAAYAELFFILAQNLVILALMGRGFLSSTFWLNVIAFGGIGVEVRGYVGGI